MRCSISMDGISGLEKSAKSVFKDAVVQRCQPESGGCRV